MRDGMATQSVVLDGIPFTIPQGCVLTRVAGPEMVTWPIVASWDPDGNLMVAESVWNKESVQQQLVSRPHRIVRLIDSDGDGVLDRRVVVAEGLSFPEGVLCVGRDMWVAAPPEIWKLTDTDGDGIYESREVWFDGKTLTHCANDLHGPWLGPDGWIYWSKSAFAEQTHEVLSGAEWKSSASHLYRRHPQGGPIDPIMTGGMDNLVDVAWLPNGERFFCATFLHHPRHGARDGIGQAAYGAVFGKPHAVLNGHPRTGPLMAPTVELGPAAPAGLLSLRTVSPELQSALNGAMSKSTPTGSEPRSAGFLLSAQFNLQKIGLHELSRESNTAEYTSKSIDLMTSSRVDFHPVDVLLDRDGSLLIVDTGGWYDLCCPSSGTDQRIAVGGIYRLTGVTEDRAATDDPRVHGLLASEGGDKSSDGAEAASSTGVSSSERVRRVWELAKRWMENQDRDAQEAMLAAARDADVDVRVAALHGIALHRWEEARDVLRENLSSEDGRCVRLAAEGLGRIGVKDDADAILERLLRPVSERRGLERWVEHGLLYALIEGAEAQDLRRHLSNPEERMVQAAVRVLEEKGQLQLADLDGVLRLAASETPETSQFGLEVLEKHSEWSPGAAAWLAMQWSESESPPPTRLAPLVARWSGNAIVQQLVEQRWSQLDRSTLGQRQFWLAIVRAMGPMPMPENWVPAIARWIDTVTEPEAEELAGVLANAVWSGSREPIQLAIQRRLDRARKLLDPATASTHASWLRWMKAMPEGTDLPEEDETLLVASTTSERPDLRSIAIEGLRKRSLQSLTAINGLMEHLSEYTPLELPVVVESVLKHRTPDEDDRLLAALLRLETAKTLSIESCLAMLRDRPEGVQSAWRDGLTGIQRPPEEIAVAVDAWLAKLPAGDPGQGYQVFRSARAACSACHQVGYVGGNVGPELSRIGKSRTRRDLLEAILFPSARLEQGYRSVKFRTVEGEVLMGLVTGETATHVEIQVAVDRKVSLARDSIEAREPSNVSVMPAGLDQQLSPQELADLIAFLENAK